MLGLIMAVNLLRIPLIALAALLLNGEFMAHGAGMFLTAPLILIYLAYVALFDVLIARFHLTDRQLFWSGATLGIFLEGFFQRNLYGSPAVLGVNWITVLVMVVAWGLFAFVLPFWIGGKVVARRSTGRLGRLGSFATFAVAAAAIVLILGLLSAWWRHLGPFDQQGAGFVPLLMLAFAGMCVKSRLRAPSYPEVDRVGFITAVLAAYLVLGAVARAIGGLAIELGYALLVLLAGSLIYFGAWRKRRFSI